MPRQVVVTTGIVVTTGTGVVTIQLYRTGSSCTNYSLEATTVIDILKIIFDALAVISAQLARCTAIYQMNLTIFVDVVHVQLLQVQRTNKLQSTMYFNILTSINVQSIIAATHNMSSC